ncbi:hypothetical protein BG011_008417 [Mortierella polycephala]|uniref:Uncharacterized protein n=1 Tax=Mortierella polycephala TaxID=41804 RepID=A0A9P6PNY8_9FUNG|nr:hypothetical protein BG011_008417 [Mortierella polycephala]
MKQQHRSSSSSVPMRDHILAEIDQQISNLTELLTEIVLLPQDSPVDPALFLAVDFLVLYDQGQRSCVASLRQERQRLLERRQAIEIELMKQETADIQLRVEDKRIQNLEMATETLAIAPESLAPLSKSRTKLLDDLGNILNKIRILLEAVHLLYEENQERHAQYMFQQQQQESPLQAPVDGELGLPVNMAMFQRHGLMDLYDHDPETCIGLLRMEHARLAARRDELELEYERQRTALLRTLQS